MTVLLVSPFQIELVRESIEACEEALAAGDASAQADLDRSRALLARYTGDDAITDHNPAPKVAAEHDPNRKRPEGGKAHRNQYGACKIRTISVPQQHFIARLVAERVIPAQGGEQEALKAFHKGTLNIRHAHDLIEWLLVLPVRADAPRSDLASDKQIACIKREGERRSHNDTDTALTVGKAQRDEEVTKKEASHALDVLFGAPFLPRERQPQAQRLEVGMYRKDGQVYKVQANQAKTGVYAKVLVLPEGGGKGRFDYAGSTAKVGLKPEHRMTLDEAKAFGVEFGVCCCCSATLTNPDSIEAGIGPICATKGF